MLRQIGPAAGPYGCESRSRTAPSILSSKPPNNITRPRAFVNVITSVLQVLLEESDNPDDPAASRAALQKATDVALAPWDE